MAMLRVSLGDGLRVSVPMHRRRDDVTTLDLCAPMAACARQLWSTGTWTPAELSKALGGVAARLAAHPHAADRWPGAADAVTRDRAAAAGTGGPTFGSVHRDWTSGRLHALRPAIGLRAHATADAAQYAMHAAPVLDHVPLRSVSVDHFSEVWGRMKRAGLRDSTCQLMWKNNYTLLNIAVVHFRWLTTNPIPRAAKPSISDSLARAWLEPEDDAELLACTDVPLGDRVLWGVIAREGMRIGEAMAMTCGALASYSQHMVMSFTRNKRRRNRAPRIATWVLQPGTARGLMRWCAWRGADLDASDPLFLPSRKITEAHNAAAHFKTDLGRAGVLARRPELLGTDALASVRQHDLRALCVTIAMAAGMSDDYIAARTGHADRGMMERYRRNADVLAATGRAHLTPLEAAIPEFGCFQPYCQANTSAVWRPGDKLPASLGF